MNGRGPSLGLPRRLDAAFPAARLATTRRVRDEIEATVRAWLKEMP